MKEFQFERKQRFSLRKYAIGACSVLLGTSLFFAGMDAQPVQATETSSTLISSHYLDEQDLSEKLKSELQWFEENKIEVKEGKEYYFVYRKLATRLPETGLFSNDGTFILGAGLLLLSFTLIKRKRGASYFLVTVFAVGGWGASISAFENLVELQPALVKRVEGQFLPSPERVQGYEFTGYYLVRDSGNKELSVDKVESPALSQKEDSSEPQSKKIVPQTASYFSSTEDLVQSPQPSYAVEKIVEAPDEMVPIGTKEEVAGNPQVEQPKAKDNSDHKTSPEEGVLNVTVEKPELLITTEEVAFQTIEQEDATLAKGQTKVVQEGVVGERTIYTEVTVVNGEKSSKVIENIITKEPVNKVIAVGTKEEVAPKPTQPVTPEPEAVKPVQPEKIEKKPADGIGQPTLGEKQTPDKLEAEPKQPDPASPAVESGDEENQTPDQQGTESNQPSKETAETKDSEPATPAVESGDEENQTPDQQGTESNQPSKETAETKDSEPATPAVESGREEDQSPAEQKGEENQLENPVEGAKDAGEQGETTVTKTYEVNPETGELSNPVEKTETTKAMRQKVILVGTKEDKPHLLPENSELENAVDVMEASREMKSVDFLTDEKIKAQLTPPALEIDRDFYKKRSELKKTQPQIRDDEVREILRKEYLEKLSIKETLDATKTDLEVSLKKVAAHTLSILGDNQQNREKVKGDIEANKEKILLGLSYINRFYNIYFGDTNIRDILAYNPSSFGKKDLTSLDWLTHLGSMSYDELRLTNSPKTFEKYFSKITNKTTLLDFLDYNRMTFTNMDGDTWLKKATKAIVVEKASKEKTDEKVELYTKLTTDPEKYGAEGLQINNRKQQNIATLLGLVNIKEPSVYAITNIATVTYGNIGTYMDTSLEKTNKAKYTEELNKVKELIELTATRQADYIDTLYRITKEENRPKLITNRVIVDTMKKYTTNTSAGIATTWSKESGPTADKGVKDFMTPLGLYSPSQNVGAEANGVGVRYFIDRVLDDRGSATYSHEMTHLLDRTVLFNNHGRRDGTAAEFYARGIFENSYIPETDTYFNLNFVYDESKKNGFYNKTPDRFKTDADLKSYMHGSFDVLYSLDYLEAEATKQLTAEEKAKYFKKITPIASTGTRARVTYTNPAVQATHNSEKISEITLTEAEKLTDINSLIDNNILVNRYIIKGFTDKGTIQANGYYLVDMFDTIYGVSQNDSGMSGDITFRKQAFELMAALGYYEGFVPYVSNQYKQAAEAENKPLSDTYIFNNILNGKSYAEFKKAQIKERVDRLNQLKPLTIQYEGKEVSLTSQKLKELMQKAVQEELKQIKAGNTTAHTYSFIETPVQKLKKAIYKAYLKDSDDFRQSIYNS
ncbi:ZmpA/ZmpB/ZmpC family metallo-endopeptidase [Streptococcus pneumoniae]|nr:ZmpA/ZmpB/ZmpC family metallo-endopeptidase [Streptococcus pneumoniae]